jgi:16S rRNA (guanine(966)-N(2))-methyltransferase RsmD
VRVIAGTAKGRPLVAPKGTDIRPTTDKVKGAIFSMLVAEAFRRAEDAGQTEAFPYRRVLDLYAGSGALGIEALSRGAAHADFVEANPHVRTALRANLERTGLAARAAVHGFKAEIAVSTFTVPYDLILADPPYSDPTLPGLLEALGRSAILAEGALVVVEHARSTVLPLEAGALRLARTRHHGTTSISLYEAHTPAGDRPVNAHMEQE